MGWDGMMRERGWWSAVGGDDGGEVNGLDWLDRRYRKESSLRINLGERGRWDEGKRERRNWKRLVEVIVGCAMIYVCINMIFMGIRRLLQLGV